MKQASTARYFLKGFYKHTLGSHQRNLQTHSRKLYTISHFLKMFSKLPLHHFQEKCLEDTFKNHDIPIEKLSWRMRSILPAKYFVLNYKDISKSKSLLDKDILKREIISAGSLGFETLLAQCLKNNEMNIAESLTKHRVEEVFRYVWMWSEDNSILRRGKSWFTSREDCLLEGKKHVPSMEVDDSPSSPFISLTLESSCKCRIHKIDENNLDNISGKPCSCNIALKDPVNILRSNSLRESDFKFLM